MSPTRGAIPDEKGNVIYRLFKFFRYLKVTLNDSRWVQCGKPTQETFGASLILDNKLQKCMDILKKRLFYA